MEVKTEYSCTRNLSQIEFKSADLNCLQYAFISEFYLLYVMATFRIVFGNFDPNVIPKWRDAVCRK